MTAGAPTAAEQTQIGIDVGGTHTDVHLVLGDQFARGKALTTYDDFSRGVISAIAVAADRLGLTLADVLGRTEAIVNGTTVATNAVTELRGSRVGVLVTTGFADTFRIAGGPRLTAFDDQLQSNVPDIVDRRAIVEIDGRINARGEELLPLDIDAVSRAASYLVEDLQIQAIAVCLMSSYVEPRHELIAEERIRKLLPDVFVSVSHRLFSVKGETRRWTTALLNAFVHADSRAYLETIDIRLRDAGFRGSLAFFQGLGGAISRSAAERFPLALLGSGPAAGAVGAIALAKTLGRDHVLLGDMGGTSFDTGIIRGGSIAIEKSVVVGRQPTGLNLVDVVSVGAGGGSIVTVSDRGVPQVGPESARSTPGPACYGQGGAAATVTDALVAMGLIDATNYLGGRIALQPDLATAALDAALGHRFGWSSEYASAVAYDLVVANMANAMRQVSVSKGHDPRDFLFLAYGGTLPLFAWAIATAVGITEVVIPDGSSVFCARGLLAGDFVLRYDHSVDWHLGDASQLTRVRTIFEGLVDRAVEAMRGEGFADEAITVTLSGDFQFPGQVFQLNMPLPDRLEEGSLDLLRHEFFTLYERTYGTGTAWEDTPPIMVSCTVEARGRRGRQAGTQSPLSGSPPGTTGVPSDDVPGNDGPGDEVAPDRHRRIYLPVERDYREVPIYADAACPPGTSIRGPALIDADDTTILVPSGVTATTDEARNYYLRRSEP